jgi:hypothetical protein
MKRTDVLVTQLSPEYSRSGEISWKIGYVTYNEGGRGSQTSFIGPFSLDDLKKLRKGVRKAIRNYENNQ